MTDTENEQADNLRLKIRQAYEEIAFGEQTDAKLTERMKAMDALCSFCEEETEKKGTEDKTLTVIVIYR